MAANTPVEFEMRTFDWVRFQVEGGSGPNVGLSELEVYAVPSVPDPPERVVAVEADGEATVSWQRPLFDGGSPITGYVVTAYLDNVVVATETVDESTTEATLSGLAEADHAFTVAAQNYVGVGPERAETVHATAIDVVGPDVITVPDSTTEFTAAFTPDDTTYKEVVWAVTEPDGSSTEKATINAAGALTVNRRQGDVIVTATNTDGGPAVVGRKAVRLDLDLSLVRDNAARWSDVTASASSEYSGDYRADKVRDGRAPGSGEWASQGEQNPWVQLDWTAAIDADKLVLYDRPGIDDANGGTLTFSDGTSVVVDDLPAGGDPATVEFEMKTFDWVRFQVAGGSGPNVGLSEIEVYARPR